MKRRNPIAKALRLFRPKRITPKRGPGSYKRQTARGRAVSEG